MQKDRRTGFTYNDEGSLGVMDIETCNRRETIPQICSWLSGEYILKNACRFILFEKRCMIIFQIIDDTVYADYVVACRKDYGWLVCWQQNIKNENRHLTEGADFFIPERRCFSFGSQDNSRPAHGSWRGIRDLLWLTSSLPNPCGLRSTPVGAKRTFTGRSAPPRSVYQMGDCLPPLILLI